MLKALTLTSIVALSATPALASQGQIACYEVQYVDESDSRYSPDLIVIYGPQGKERIQVTCGQSEYDSSFDWSSYGPNSSDFVHLVATEWCF